MILLDTHVLLWWQAGGERLSRAAVAEIMRAATVLISPISCWEIGTLLAKGRIALDRDLDVWLRDLFSQGQVEAAVLTPAAAGAAGRLGAGEFHGDPADRLLYTTALELAVPLLSKDDRLHRAARVRGDVRVIW